MTLTALHQFLPSLARGDAIGEHALRLRALLRAAGLTSELFAEEVHPNARGEAREYTTYGREVPADARVALLYHASTGSAMADFLRAQPWPLLVDYHNITEARFFDRWEPVAADRAREARAELARLAPNTKLAIAHSRYSEQELSAADFTRTRVVPLLLDLREFDAPADPATAERLARDRERSPGARWVFVGRVAPNKCHHDVIAALAAYRHLVDPGARLTFVGGMTSARYRRALDDLVAELGLAGVVEFTDSVALPVMLAHLGGADVFVCLSEHEGFLVPVVEAMYLGVPVVAFGATAVPETVGAAGVVISSKDPVTVAAAVDRVLHDETLRAQLVGAGRARAAELAGPHIAQQWTALLTAPEVLAGDA